MTATLSDRLEELARRVEALTGPRRETDAEIAIAVGVVPEGAFRPCAAIDPGTFATGPYSFWSCELYTKSIDAALTLVPEGGKDNWSLVGGRYWQAIVGSNEDQADAAAPALALTAASLRALATLQGGEG